MKKYSLLFIKIFILVIIFSCTDSSCQDEYSGKIKPVLITRKVAHDADDPAIWYNSSSPENSLVLGTDKHNSNGRLYVFDLSGGIIAEKTVSGLKYPNNVDVEYGFRFPDDMCDIAVVTERGRNAIRIFSLPDMKPLDHGGIPVFENERYRRPMGVSLYRRATDGKIFAILSRKAFAKTDHYLWQYELTAQADGSIGAKFVRAFGKFSGIKEIEAIVVDDSLGFVYYSDEGYGIHKYAADPNAAGANDELACFGRTDFKADVEGIAIYQTGRSSGWIIVSDQQADRFNIYDREGSGKNRHDHRLVTRVKLSTHGSDGCDVISFPLNGVFQNGLFVAMSDDKTFQFYHPADIFSN